MNSGVFTVQVTGVPNPQDGGGHQVRIAAGWLNDNGELENHPDGMDGARAVALIEQAKPTLLQTAKHPQPAENRAGTRQLGRPTQDERRIKLLTA